MTGFKIHVRGIVGAATLLLGLATGSTAMAQGAFYDAAPDEIAGSPGTVIRTEPLSGAPLGADAYRVLYRSTGLQGEPIAVSGVVVIPRTAPPAGGRRIVAWAHPTSGIVPRCAPSLALLLFQQIMGSRDFMREGYIIAATDYPGLGTPGPHPYLVGASEAHAVLDSVRAARAVAGAGAGNRFALWGHSQGGQAVLYSTILARKYAPELELVGVAAAAPATELGPLMEADLPTPGGKNLLAMTLWSWARVFNAPIEKVVDPAAMPAIDRLAAVCIESVLDMIPRQAVARDLEKRFLTVDNLTQLEPWKTLLADNTIGLLPKEIPVFLAQGTKDDTVDPPVTAAYAKRLCAAGSAVHFMSLPGVGHAFAARDSAAAAIAWMGDRFAGTPAPSDCGALP
jgi:acetyl esterase/lipase